MPENTDNEVFLDFPQAISLLAPDCSWSFGGNDYSGLNWNDDPAKKPSEEAVLEKAWELYRALPLKALRFQRDRLLKDCDWVVARSVDTGKPVPQEWAAYRQALRDITETYPNPQLERGKLINIDWPVKPE